MTLRKIPTPDPQSGLRALQALIQERNPLAALAVFHKETGDIFQVNLPGFKPVVMVGPQAAHFVLVDARHELRWRNESDPVTDLLRHGVLVEDGPQHDTLRRMLNPPLHKKMLESYIDLTWKSTQEVCQGWQTGQDVVMLDEMRKIALLVLFRNLYQVDFSPTLKSLWEAILSDIRYISPGLWMIWKNAPHPGYRRAMQKVDAYLYQIIHERRRLLTKSSEDPTDMLGILVATGMDDGLIRDQLLTMLIAGHDTVTALMAWTIYLLGSHPAILRQVRDEIDSLFANQLDTPTPDQINRLSYLSQVIKESLRLYPPIHLGSRLVAQDLEFAGYQIPAGVRVIYSIYLTQRDERYWPEAHIFDPDRFAQGRHIQPYTWIPFGGGARNCIGAAFGQMEAKLVLAYVIKSFDLELIPRRIIPHMGATLEPHPGVPMHLKRRQG